MSVPVLGFLKAKAKCPLLLFRKIFFKTLVVAGVVVSTCSLSTEKAKAGRLRIEGQPELHSETMSQKKTNKNLQLFLWECLQKVGEKLSS
jgi:hypothetical protein